MPEISESESRMLQSEIDRLKGRIENLEDRIKEHAESDGANNAQTEISEKTDNDPVSEKTYNEPRPEDDTWRTMLSTYVNGHHWGGYPVEPKQIGIEPDDDYSKAKTHEAVDSLIDYIDDLEQELEEVREERDYLKTNLKDQDYIIERSYKKYGDLQNQIKEAREWIGRNINKAKATVLSQILEGSDE